MDCHRPLYDEIYIYAMGRPGFLLQHVVDAFAVQCATASSKPVAIVFGLVGLYLRVERQFSGRQIQLAHMKLARRKREWEYPPLPHSRGEFTVIDVLKAPAGIERDEAIDVWCRSVWGSLGDNRPSIITLLQDYKIIPSAISDHGSRMHG